MAEKKLSVAVGANIKDFQAKMGQLEKDLGKMTKSANRSLAPAMAAIGTAFKAVAVAGGAGFAALVVGSVKGASSLEQYRNTLNVVLKDQQKAAETMAWAVDFANKTPFETDSVVEATVRLSAYGLKAQEVLPSIGNMAAVMNKDIMQAVEAVADAQTGELERLKEFGITKKMIVEQGAKTMRGVELVNNKGQIVDQENFNKALFQLMDERFKGGMEMQANSMKGLWSTVTGTFKTTLATMAGTSATGEIVIGGPFDTIKNKIKGVVDRLSEWQQNGQLQEWATKAQEALATFWSIGEKVFNGLVATGKFIVDNWGLIGPILAGVLAGFLAFQAVTTVLSTVKIAMAALNFVMAANPIGLIVLAVAGLVIAGIALYENWDTIKAVAQELWIKITEAWDGVKAVTLQVWDGIKGYFAGVWDNIKAIFNAAFSIIGPVLEAGWNALMATTTAVWETIKTYFQTIWEVIKTIFAAGFLIIYDIVTGNWGEIGTVFTAAWDKIKTLCSDAWDHIKDVWGNAFDAIVNYADTYWNTIKDLFSRSWSAIKQFFIDGWNGLVSGASNGMTNVKDTIINLWGSVATFFENLPSQALQWGIDIINGMINGITQKWTDLKASISNLINNLIDGVKEQLKSHSPSEVFYQIGTSVPQGLAQGISAESPLVIQEMDNLVGIVSKKTQAALSSLNSLFSVDIGSGGGGGGWGNNVSAGLTPTTQLIKDSLIANGAVSASSSAWGKAEGFAGGGVIQRPVLMTDLATGRVAGIAGEAGTEAIVPMRGQAMAGAGGITINVTGNTFLTNGQMERFVNHELMPKVAQLLRSKTGLKI